MMGSPGSESGRPSNESIMEVTISRPFEMSMTQVTQNQWTDIMGDNPSDFKAPNRPVEKVSWDDVQKYIAKLNELDPHHTYRLPTEAEWEYAARAGTTTAYSFGDNPAQLDEYAWNSQNAGSQTHDVAELKPNPSGLYDMHGNVWEWTQDWYGNYPAGAVTDPTGPATGSDRVLRGGGWSSYPGGLRSAQRLGYSPGGRYSFFGFRLCRTAVAPKSAFIKLTQGKEAMVDEEDVEGLCRLSWHFKKHRSGGYAASAEGISMSRFLLRAAPGEIVDHINHDTLDNRKSNLRIVTNQQNQFNQKPQMGGSSQYKGVHWVTAKKCWRAQVRLDKKLHLVGLFKDEKEAAKAYDIRAKELFGEYAYLNFPELLLPSPLPGARALAGRPDSSSSPIAAHRNKKGQLHNTEGPALLYADGFALYMIDGQWIDPSEFKLGRFLK